MRKLARFLIIAHIFLALSVALTVFIFGQKTREVARQEAREEYIIGRLGEMCANKVLRAGYNGEKFYALCK